MEPEKGVFLYRNQHMKRPFSSGMEKAGKVDYIPAVCEKDRIHPPLSDPLSVWQRCAYTSLEEACQNQRLLDALDFQREGLRSYPF